MPSLLDPISIVDAKNFERNNLNSEDYKFYFDSRQITNNGNNVFLAINSDVNDGFNYIEEKLLEKISVLVFDYSDKKEKKVRQWAKDYPNIIFIGAYDSISYLQELASFKINKIKKIGTIIGITGSNGKTSTKEFLAKLLNGIFPNKVSFTKGNFNNHIGLPLTILDFNLKKDKVLILEMGTNFPGEIEELCRVGRPDWGLITNIGTAHIGMFGTKENICKEKTSLFKSIDLNGKGYVVNCIDELLIKFKREKKAKTFGSDSCDFSFLDMKEESFSLNKKLIENKNVLEDYNKLNLAMSLSLCLCIYANKEKELLGLARKIKLPDNNRSQWVTTDKGEKIFLDAYNANPSSMERSISSYIESIDRNKFKKDRIVFILGDMNELGDQTIEHHESIGALLKNKGIKRVIFVGNYCKHYADGFGNEAVCFKNTNELRRNFKKLTNDADSIFIKGSRSLQLETLLDITNH